MVNITEGSAPPPDPVPVSYCSSQGNNSSYEWVEAVNVNGYTYISGNSNGYADFTGQTALNLTRGSNSIILTPGFGFSSYTEYWNIWVDLNQDGQFSAQELMYSGVSASSLPGSFQLPVDTLSGSTRMRVSMKYGAAPTACESFTYGDRKSVG